MSPIQTIYKGRLPCKAVPSLHYGISRIMCQGSSFKNDYKLFLEPASSFLIPGLLGLVLPGSFRGLGCSKIRFPNGRDPDSNRI